MKTLRRLLAASLLIPFVSTHAAEGRYPIAPTGQNVCYGTAGDVIACSGRNEALGGQDACFAKAPLRYRDNGNGTVTDLNTGLIWQQNLGAKTSWAEARAGAAEFRLAGQSDWRLPTIKELYSLINFSGSTPMPGREGKPFIDGVFDFHYGDTAAGERLIDVQEWSATEYVGRTMGRDATVFSVNFADGRIKGYPKVHPGRGENRMFVRYVRGNPAYGHNQFVDNRNGTVTDAATCLVWMHVDSVHLKSGPYGDGRMDWPQALAWAARLDYAGHSDWRLPNAKKLQSIVDYTRSPQTTGSAAISPLFKSSAMSDEGGRSNYAFYWTSTTHLDGRAAGAQRSDTKIGNPADYPSGFGPQGDVRRIYNMVRLVRKADR